MAPFQLLTMNDSEFDKRYADKMRQNSAPDFSDEDWERLTPLLDKAQQRRWRVLPLWWLGALSGLLICSNLAWWWMWQDSEKKSEARWLEWKQTLPSETVSRDTVWSKAVVRQYDTIYRTVVLRSVPAYGQIVGNVPAVSGSSLSYNNTITEGLTGPVSANGTTGSAWNREPHLRDSLRSYPKLARVSEPFECLPIEPAFVNFSNKQIQIKERDFLMAPMKHAKSTGQPTFVPRHYRLGAVGGLLIPHANSLSSNAGYLLGLNGEIAFSDQLALTFEGAYSAVGFKGYELDKSLGLPSVSSPGDDYELKYFKTEEGLKPILQLNAGLRYWIMAQKRLSPYLGLGYTAQWHLPYELQVEYTHKITGQEKERSEDVPTHGPVSLLDLNVGLRYRFWRQLSFQAGVDFLYKIDKSQPGIPVFWGVKSAMLYEF